MDLDERWIQRFNAAELRRILKRRAVNHLGGKCFLCPYDRCDSAFDFHHIDPNEKDFEISTRMSWVAIVEELDKCVLLCATCHREVHAGLHPSLLVLEDARDHESAGGLYGDA